MYTNKIVSIATDRTQGNAESYAPDISGDGRYITFYSTANNLVPGDTNDTGDIFLHDQVSGTTTRVNVADDGTQSNNESYNPSISGDGRYITYESHADNLVQGDTNGRSDIFVYDQVLGTTTRVSIASDGTQTNSSSSAPSISGDGRYVAFYSNANNLVLGDTNDRGDIFVHDQVLRITTRVSVASNEIQSNHGSYFPSISEDGRYVTFTSDANNLVNQDTNNKRDVFVHDRSSRQTIRVSVGNNGNQGNDSSNYSVISGDGRYVVFQSDASNLMTGISNNFGNIFIRDLTLNTTTRIPVRQTSDDDDQHYFSYYPSISRDGNYIAFQARADAEYYEIFVYNRSTNTTIKPNDARYDIDGNNSMQYPAISGDGRYLAFQSEAQYLVPGDINNVEDIFVTDLVPSNDISYNLSLNPQRFSEGNGNNNIQLTYTITRSGGIHNSSQIDYNLSGTATNGTDYLALPAMGTINFNPDETEKTVVISVVGDTQVEPDETIALTLSNPTAPGGTATIVEGIGTATILNDDITVVINGTQRNDSLVGGSSAEIINGLQGNDVILANNGDDTLNGDTGADIMKGGAGNDIYSVDNLGDTIEETVSNGIDRVNSNVNYTLGNHLENLTLTGTNRINGVGNNLANLITGNEANNILEGFAGDDTIIGGGGNDTIVGGTGRDVLLGGTGKDQFRFTSPTGGVVRLEDFNPVDDCVEVLATAFNLPVGVLNSSSFVVGTRSTNANHRFIYNNLTGDLLFDRDGSGRSAAVGLANIPTLGAFTQSDIIGI